MSKYNRIHTPNLINAGERLSSGHSLAAGDESGIFSAKNLLAVRGTLLNGMDNVRYEFNSSFSLAANEEVCIAQCLAIQDAPIGVNADVYEVDIQGYARGSVPMLPTIIHQKEAAAPSGNNDTVSGTTEPNRLCPQNVHHFNDGTSDITTFGFKGQIQVMDREQFEDRYNYFGAAIGSHVAATLTQLQVHIAIRRLDSDGYPNNREVER